MSKSKTATAEAPVRKNELSPSRLKILAALAKAPNGLTRNEMAVKTGITKGWSKLLGAATKESSANGGMEEAGLVKSSKQEERKGLVYIITAAGRKALEKASK